MVKKTYIFWLILASILLMLLDNFHMLEIIKEPAEKIIIPIKRETYQIDLATKSTVDVISQYPVLIKVFEEKDRLRKLNDEMNLELQSLRNENIKLRMQLEAPLPSSYSYVPAKVLSVDHFMEIDVGEKEKIGKGMIVINGNILIGKVISVSSGRSLVMLLNNLESKVPAKTSRGAKGILTGGSDKNLILDKILQKDPLFLDDFVYTTGEDNYPPNLLIGKVAYITVLDVAAYKQAKVASSVDYAKEETVFVVTSK